MDIKIFDTMPNDARLIREAVFVQEQGFKEEFDETDNTCIHLVMYSGDEPAGTCRLYKSPDCESYVIGRIAVLKKYRGHGTGALLMKEAEKTIKNLKGDSIVLHAQCRVKGFYEKQGFAQFGDEDTDEGCPHIWMRKNLQS